MAVLDPSGLVQLQMYPRLIGDPVAGAAVLVDDPLELAFFDDDPHAAATSVTTATTRTPSVQLRARVPLCLISSPVLAAYPACPKIQS
ncbi:MAG TPA: hypothetical protein VLL25_05445 [Acidimicrobiales bacterium]|nr:hypothetical protein [Acidimicrobiales bacterium]